MSLNRIPSDPTPAIAYAVLSPGARTPSSAIASSTQPASPSSSLSTSSIPSIPSVSPTVSYSPDLQSQISNLKSSLMPQSAIHNPQSSPADLPDPDTIFLPSPETIAAFSTLDEVADAALLIKHIERRLLAWAAVDAARPTPPDLDELARASLVLWRVGSARKTLLAQRDRLLVRIRAAKEKAEEEAEEYDDRWSLRPESTFSGGMSDSHDRGVLEAYRTECAYNGDPRHCHGACPDCAEFVEDVYCLLEDKAQGTGAFAPPDP